MKPKVGIMNITGRGAALDLCIQRAKDTMKLLEAELSGKMDLVYSQDYLLTEEEMDTAGKLMYDEDVDCIFAVINAWFSSNILIRVLRRTNKPILVLSIPYNDTNAITGATCFRGGLNEIGINNTFLYGSPDEAGIKRELTAFASAAQVLTILRHSKYGFFGGQSLGMYTTMFDYAQLARAFGIDTTHEDQYRIVTVAESLPQETVDKAIADLGKRFSLDRVPAEHAEKSVRVYLALKKIVDEKNYDFISVKCQPEMIDNYASCCLGLSLLTDEGVPAACEGDTNAAISMYLLTLLSKTPSYFGDLAKIDKENNTLCLANCGTAATSLAKKVVLNDQYDWMGTAQGIVTSFVCKKGDVTVLRLIRQNGEFKMMAAYAKTEEREDLLPTKEYWPHAFIKLGSAEEVDTFLQNVNSNHLHFTYGDYLKELEYIAKLLNIKFILF